MADGVRRIDREPMVLDVDEAERQIRLSARLAALEAHLVEVDRRFREMDERLATLGAPSEATVLRFDADRQAVECDAERRLRRAT